MSRPVAVLRRRFDSVFGWIVEAGALIATCSVLLNPFPGSGFAGQLEFVAAMAPLMWFIWMVGPHPVVKVYDTGVVVTNWFRRYQVPWAELSMVESTNEVNLVTRSGERINVAAGAFSVASSLMGNKVQHQIRDAIEQARPNPVPADEGGVRKGFDLCLWQFLALVAFLTVVGWLGTYSPV